MTKRLLLSFGITILAISQLTAQVKKGDFGISLNLSYLTEYTFDNSYATGGAPFGISFGYAFSNKCIIGGELGYLNLTTTNTNVKPVYGYSAVSGQNDSIYKNGYSYHFDINKIFYLITFQYHWLNKERHSLYSGIALGSGAGTVDLVYSDSNHSNEAISLPNLSGFEYQITTIGYRAFFGKHFGVHLELGFGIKGIACGGLDLKF
jgi:hypothetical protein